MITEVHLINCANSHSFTIEERRSHNHSCWRRDGPYICNERCRIHLIGRSINQAFSNLTNLAYILGQKETNSPCNGLGYITLMLSTWLDVIREANAFTTFQKYISCISTISYLKQISTRWLLRILPMLSLLHKGCFIKSAFSFVRCNGKIDKE